ncbi:hypothetical protein CYMTET_4161 [Cymbomonas tetramitiformis]|uniref:protein-serine/threonine phosphatase n=1 Tax=Cymbomonas tetramitiformis TaxID=36881 RepID=A0AAE0H279_9CHLO|nr:hypothetical protein CYMTET_4161 [Cymbomonas tetramitiformis]
MKSPTAEAACSCKPCLTKGRIVGCCVCREKTTKREPANLVCHNFFTVKVCSACSSFLSEGEWLLDEKGEDIYCRFCGSQNDSNVALCDTPGCHRAFCEICMRNFFGDEMEALPDHWSCYICQPEWKHLVKSDLKEVLRLEDELRKSVKRPAPAKSETSDSSSDDDLLTQRKTRSDAINISLATGSNAGSAPGGNASAPPPISRSAATPRSEVVDARELARSQQEAQWLKAISNTAPSTPRSAPSPAVISAPPRADAGNPASGAVGKGRGAASVRGRDGVRASVPSKPVSHNMGEKRPCAAGSEDSEATRNKVQAFLKKGLATAMLSEDPAGGKGELDIEALARTLEQHLWENCKGQQIRQRARARSILFALKNNADLAARVRGGSVQMRELANMTVDALATQDEQAKREEIREKSSLHSTLEPLNDPRKVVKTNFHGEVVEEHVVTPLDIPRAQEASTFEEFPISPPAPVPARVAPQMGGRAVVKTPATVHKGSSTGWEQEPARKRSLDQAAATDSQAAPGDAAGSHPPRSQPRLPAVTSFQAFETQRGQQPGVAEAEAPGVAGSRRGDAAAKHGTTRDPAENVFSDAEAGPPTLQRAEPEAVERGKAILAAGASSDDESEGMSDGLEVIEEVQMVQAVQHDVDEAEVVDLADLSDDETDALLNRVAARRRRYAAMDVQWRVPDRPCLVLDADQVIMHTTPLEGSRDVFNVVQREELFEIGDSVGRQLLTKLRPGAREFLQALSQEFCLVLCLAACCSGCEHLTTRDNELLAQEVAEHLDPQDRLFGGRLVGRSMTNWADELAELAKRLGSHSSTLVLSSEASMWMFHTALSEANVLDVLAYNYFPSHRGDPRRAEEFNYHSYLARTRRLGQGRGCDEDSNYLIHTMLHQALLPIKTAWRTTQAAGGVPQAVGIVRSKVLQGCKLLFTGIHQASIKEHVSQEHMDKLRAQARRLGAMVAPDGAPVVACTHVISGAPDGHETDKMRDAVAQRKHVVREKWLIMSELKMVKQNEKSYPCR